MTLSLLTADVAQVIAAAAFLAVMAERLVEYFIAPLFKRFAPAQSWVLMYFVAVVGGVLSYLANINLLGGVFPSELVGVIASAVIVGGGSEFLHQLIGVLNRTNR
jgi:hypothetical protein